MKLREVLKGIPNQSEQQESDVTRVTSDSRELVPGCVFVAIKGGSHDGHKFVEEAWRKGAVAVIGEEDLAAPRGRDYLRVPDSRYALARLAANFFGNPSHRMLVIGVTGTSGKTTTSYLVESILKAQGYKVGLIGTVSFRFGEKVFPSTHTTPGPVELQQLLAQMRDAGCNAVSMEVSSHALKQHRSAGIAFDGMIFTNLSPEHLDFHPDMEDYFSAKRMLFTDYARAAIEAGKKPFAAINRDDPYGQRLLEELGKGSDSSSAAGLRVGSFGLDGAADFPGQDLQISLEGISGQVAGVSIRSPMTGRFNGSNILGAVAVASGLGVRPEAIAKGVWELKLVPGRLEKVPNSRGINVLVDYAHKPDALEKVLKTLREVRSPGQRIVTVVGCGGDRDRKKRPVMGRLAVELSDHAVITSDNPRTEDPQRIIQEVLEGTRGSSNFLVEPDRKRAIFEAIRMANPGDVVLIAGKGHEDYQIIASPGSPGGVRKIHFDDREVAAEALNHSKQQL